jgi:hypothetical protein
VAPTKPLFWVLACPPTPFLLAAWSGPFWPKALKVLDEPNPLDELDEPKPELDPKFPEELESPLLLPIERLPNIPELLEPPDCAQAGPTCAIMPSTNSHESLRLFRMSSLLQREA